MAALESTQLLTELEPVVEDNLNRHLAIADEWMPHEYVPWSLGRDFADLGGDPARINPLAPAELVIDHSVQIDVAGRRDAFDLAQERIESFSAFRFLYERLIGADARPWLPSAFCAASALPQIKPSRRKVLLQSLSEAAATAPGWSDRAPSFFPEYIEREAA